MEDRTMAETLHMILVELDKWPVRQRSLWYATKEQLPEWATYGTFSEWVNIMWQRRYIIRTMSGELKVSKAGKDWLIKRM